MCGRYVAYTDEDYTEMANIVNEVQQKLGGTEELKTGEIFPTDLAPILLSREGAMQAEPMMWGFRRWDGGGVVINARAETAAQKQMFRASLFTRRLVVPSTGFFEWQRVDGRKKKDKYWIRRPGETMLYMAGSTGITPTRTAWRSRASSSSPRARTRTSPSCTTACRSF
jgi:putative SOS response-associated peptidase YedK